jgi:hypothetical protein
MASAFISYAHEDEQFMISLVDQLQGQEHEIRYDQVVLNIGDSLIRKLSQEIADGDFLIAIISPDSVTSEWCQRELAMAATQGINEARVKVLPVTFRGAERPPILTDTFCGDADRHNVETVAKQLVAAMNAHLAGADDAEAARVAEQAEEAEGDPPNETAADDATVRDIDEVARQVWDVFDVWHAVWDHRGGNVFDLDDPQRRLRYALDVLPQRVALALPLVRQLANSRQGDIFEGDDTSDLEREIRQELVAVRARIAQGLPVKTRWLVIANNGTVPVRRDVVAYHWTIQRGDEQRNVLIYISGTAMASEDAGLLEEVAAAKTTEGRSALASIVGLDDPPTEITVTTAGVSLTGPDE